MHAKGHVSHFLKFLNLLTLTEVLLSIREQCCSQGPIGGCLWGLSPSKWTYSLTVPIPVPHIGQFISEVSATADCKNSVHGGVVC